MRGTGEASASEPYTVARYRLQLVCEEHVPYDPKPCDDPDWAAAYLRPFVQGYAQEVMGVRPLFVLGLDHEFPSPRIRLAGEALSGAVEERIPAA